MFGEALSIFTRALGIDNGQNAQGNYGTALAKLKSGDMTGALASAKEAVRIFTKHGITDAVSQQAVDLLRDLEAGHLS